MLGYSTDDEIFAKVKTKVVAMTLEQCRIRWIDRAGATVGNPDFNVKKATQAAAIVLAEIPTKPADYYLLLKLLYMADRISLTQTGHFITTAELVAMKAGPLPIDVYRCITKQHPSCAFWNAHIHREGYKLSLAADPGTNSLCAYDIAVLRNVARRYGTLHPALVGRLTHALAEFKKNRVDKGMKAIPTRDILEAVGRKGQAEKIIQEATDRAAIRRLFKGARG